MKGLTTALLCLLLSSQLSDAKPRARVTSASISKLRTDTAGSADYAAPGLALVTVARFYLGRNPTDMSHVWCGRFMRLVLRHATGRDPGPAYDAAYSFRRIGHPTRAQPGAIVVWSRSGGGGHVGIIVQVTRPGQAIVISGNDGPAGGRLVLERERSIAGASFRHL